VVSRKFIKVLSFSRGREVRKRVSANRLSQLRLPRPLLLNPSLRVSMMDENSEDFACGDPFIAFDRLFKLFILR
jgi:hypothetical protein